MYNDDVDKEITDNVNILDYISRYVDFKMKNPNEYFGLCPFHREDTPSFSVSPNVKKFFCFGCGCGGDVISFVSKYNKISRQEASERLAHEYKINRVKKICSPTVSILKQLSTSKAITTAEHTVLNESVLNQFAKTDVKLWVDEGIPQKIIDKYGVRIDTNANRIVYPVYDNYGNLINIKGRTMFSNYKELKTPKYINYYKVGDLDYFQGYHLKQHIIQSVGEIVLFEGIKSCMKLDSYGIYNSVSCETHKINPHQIKALVGFRCDVVIAFDKDVAYEKIVKNVSMLSRFVNVYIVRDTEELLGPKDSPVDKGFEVWQKLYNNRVKV